MTEPRREPWMVDGDPRTEPAPQCPHPSGTREYEEWWEAYFRVKLPLYAESNRRLAAARRAMAADRHGHDFTGERYGDYFAARDGRCACGQDHGEYTNLAWDAERTGASLPLCPMTEGAVFYLDCFHGAALLGDRFPVSTYGPSTWAKLVWLRAKIGDSFDRTEIVRETLGQGPLEEDYWPGSGRPR